jgi:LuxR family transcriptional regulator, maltose regulon positive regulatory protein
LVVPAQDLEGPPKARANALAPSPVTPLISTKLHAPRVARYRDRPRLDAHLDHCLEDMVRLTLLSAPPGYGKSVAVAGWLESRGLRTAWLSLDAADNDPVRFLRYVAAAIAPLRPGLDNLTALLDAAPGPEAAAILIDAIAAADDPFVLVLDDYQVITREPVHALLRVIIEHGPPFAHLVVISREDPPFALPRLRAHRRLVEVRADELRYTPYEAAAYLGDAPGVALDDEHVGRLVERTEGWIAGLQLAAISLRDQPAAASLIDAFTGSQRFVLDYLAAEVLDRLDPELRSFLVHLSVVERFTAGLCREMTRRADSGALLERAERMNLFLIPLDLDRRWYRFHHLFADYLRTLLDPAEEVALRERAADYLEAADLVEEAIGQAVAAGSTERAIRLLERQARRTYDAGELTMLVTWLDALPPDQVAANPELVCLWAISRFFVGRVEDAGSACARGEAASPDGARGGLLVVRALIASFGMRPDAVGLALAAVDAVGDDDFFEGLAQQALASGQLASGQFEAAATSARRSLAAAAGSGSSVVVPAMTALASALNMTGHRGEAEALCRDTLTNHAREARRLGGGTPYAVYWLGAMRYEAGDLPGAVHELERSWAAMGTFGFGRAVLTMMVSYLALARQATGSHEGALEAVRTVRRDARAAGLMGIAGGLAEIEARLWLAGGDLDAAGRWAAEAGRPDAVDPGAASSWPDLARIMTSARVRLAQGRVGEAAQLLDRARATAEAANDTADRISIGVLDAALSTRTGDGPGAERALEAALRLAEPGGYVRRIVDDGAALASLLPGLRWIAPPYVDKVIAAMDVRAGAAPGGPRRTGPSVWRDQHGELVESLTDRELEVLRLIARGRSDAAIARELVVSLATAKWHAAHIRAKLGVESRTQAVLRAQTLALV